MTRLHYNAKLLFKVMMIMKCAKAITFARRYVGAGKPESTKEFHPGQ